MNSRSRLEVRVFYLARSKPEWRFHPRSLHAAMSSSSGAYVVKERQGDSGSSLER